MKVRPYRLPSHTRLQVCEKRLKEALAGWTLEWLMRPTDAEVSCLPAFASQLGMFEQHFEESYLLAEKLGDGWVIAAFEGGFAANLTCLLAGGHEAVVIDDGPVAPIESRVAANAREELIKALAGALGLSEHARVNEAEKQFGERVKNAGCRGAGGILADIALGGARLKLLAAPGLTERIVVPARRSSALAAPLIPCVAAIRGRELSIEVSAGSTTITIGELQSLKPGDLLRLDRSIHDPLPLQTSPSRPIGAAHLGIRQGRRAIQLVSNLHH